MVYLSGNFPCSTAQARPQMNWSGGLQLILPIVTMEQNAMLFHSTVQTAAGEVIIIGAQMPKQKNP
jgi:coproporphyrinogen III oxidase